MLQYDLAKANLSLGADLAAWTILLFGFCMLVRHDYVSLRKNEISKRLFLLWAVSSWFWFKLSFNAPFVFTFVLTSFDQVLTKQVVHFEIGIQTFNVLLLLWGAFGAKEHAIGHCIEQVKQLLFLLFGGSHLEKKSDARFHIDENRWLTEEGEVTC